MDYTINYIKKKNSRIPNGVKSSRAPHKMTDEEPSSRPKKCKFPKPSISDSCKVTSIKLHITLIWSELKQTKKKKGY